MSARELITEHLGLWTEAVTKKSSSGRGSNGKVELTGVKKLRELILELAVRGKLVTQDKDDGPVSLLLKKIESEKSAQLKAKAIRKPKKLPEIQEIEQPFPIPVSWRYCRLNELGVWGSGATPKRGNSHYYGGGIPWFKSGELYKDFIDSSEETITELAVQETSVRMNQPGDVLIAMYGATIGKASILEVAGTTNQAVCACTPWPGISNRFLLLLLKAYRSRFIAMGAGGAQPNISREKIIATVIGLPPEEEQHRIVQKVDELMALCDRLEQQTSDQLEAHETLVDTLLGTLTQSENATELADNWARLAAHFDTLFTTEQSIDKLKQTILQLAVMGRLAKPANQEEEPIESLVENLASERADGDNKTSQRKKKDSPQIASKGFRHPIPENWKWIKFGETWINSFYGPRFAKHDYVPSGGIPTVRTTDMDDKGRIDLRNAPTVLVPANKKELYLLEKNDILVTRSGSIGVTAVYDLETPAIPSAYLIRLRLCPSINPHYVFIYLNSPHGQKSLGVHSTAVGVPNVNATKMASFDFPLPPKEEQSRIVQKVDELIALCDQLKERLNQACKTRCQLAETIVEQGLSA
ncbi:restriction endonuclease subunit S [Marinobacter nauticus]|uniref:Type I restriction enzyme S subunit n=1 Tax=Marinobacter nauticus TaxID=2743 RepID=A0A368VE35_MARNT|nr:restriction endonuclease subunit S [Marinobacter nauticus]RBP76398.1 type I restriction enzyme S subunit [Marinobacter nauticus]RCW37271.1 type I restriction enzyme S subunit [Marinobacter nauticus]